MTRGTRRREVEEGRLGVRETGARDRDRRGRVLRTSDSNDIENV